MLFVLTPQNLTRKIIKGYTVKGSKLRPAPWEQAAMRDPQAAASGLWARSQHLIPTLNLKPICSFSLAWKFWILKGPVREKQSFCLFLSLALYVSLSILLHIYGNDILYKLHRTKVTASGLYILFESGRNPRSEGKRNHCTSLYRHQLSTYHISIKCITASLASPPYRPKSARPQRLRTITNAALQANSCFSCCCGLQTPQERHGNLCQSRDGSCCHDAFFFLERCFIDSQSSFYYIPALHGSPWCWGTESQVLSSSTTRFKLIFWTWITVCWFCCFLEFWRNLGSLFMHRHLFKRVGGENIIKYPGNPGTPFNSQMPMTSTS